jgi:lipoprotein-releasing system permease protein
MNFPFFIAKRVAASGQKSFTRLIIRIAIAAVALSIAVMIITTSLIRGFKSEISEKMFGFWGHIHINSVQQTTSFEPSPINANPTFLDTLKNLQNIGFTATLSHAERDGASGTHRGEAGSIKGGVNKKSFGGIKHVQAYANKAGIIKTKDNFEGIVLKGVGKDYDWRFIKENLVDGRTLNVCDTCKDIMISNATANRLKLKVGNKFVVHFVQNNQEQQRLFQICGIYKTGIDEYDKRFALVDLSQVQTLLGWSENQVAGFEVFIEDLRDLKPMNEYVYNELISNDLSAQTIKEEQPAIFDWLDLQDVNEQVILVLMLIVSIINMVTALLILILERTNMIGTLKALGTSGGRIQQIFLYYGAIIVCVGLLIGNVLGIGLSLLEQKFHFIKLSESNYYLSYAPIKFDFLTIMGLNIGTLLIITLFLFLPTLMVLSISPVKAIRFK